MKQILGCLFIFRRMTCYYDLTLFYDLLYFIKLWPVNLFILLFLFLQWKKYQFCWLSLCIFHFIRCKKILLPFYLNKFVIGNGNCKFWTNVHTGCKMNACIFTTASFVKKNICVCVYGICFIIEIIHCYSKKSYLFNSFYVF